MHHHYVCTNKDISDLVFRERKVISIGIENFLHENKPGLCVIGIVTGLPAVILSVLSLLHSEGDSGIIKWAYDLIGNWAFWLILIGFILLIPGIYYLAVFYKQLKEFKGLMKTDSKAMFIKNQDRVEELAWRLHPKYEKMVIQKKEKLKVK